MSFWQRVARVRKAANSATATTDALPAEASIRDCCLQCGERFRRNSILLHTQFGRTIVFDTRQSRLWAVCAKCGRWNLSAQETRIEAIEECQRVFDRISVKDTTGGISRGIVGDMRLISVGEPAVHELALLRHSRRLQRRDRFRSVLGGVIMILLMVAPPGLMLAGVTPLLTFPLLWWPLFVIRSLATRRVVFRCCDDGGLVHDIRGRDLTTATLGPAGDAEGWCLRLHTDAGLIQLGESEAIRVLPRLGLAPMNVEPDVLRDALRFLNDHPLDSRNDVYAAVAKEQTLPVRPRQWGGAAREGTIYRLPLYQRLALDIASTEILERPSALNDARAITAELESAQLIAGISDDLLLPAAVVREFERLKSAGPQD